MRHIFSNKNTLPHHGAEISVAVLTALLLAIFIVATLDIRFSYRAALMAGIMGVFCLGLIPNKRMALVVTWILVHPLSIEKVFHVATPPYSELLPPQVVISAADLVLAALLAYLCMEGLIKKQNVFRFPAAMFPLAAFTVWTFLVFLITGITVTGALASVHGLKMFLYVLAMVSAVRTKPDLNLVLSAIVLAVGIQVVLVVTASMTGERFGFSSKITNDLMAFSGSHGQSHLRATGTVGHVNQEAGFLTFFSLPLLGFMFAGKAFKRWVAWMVFIGTIIAVILTFSRSAWVSVFIALSCLFVVAFMKGKIPFRHWRFGPVLFVGVLLTLVAFGKPMFERLWLGDEGATSSRKRAIVLALDLIKRHPIIGVGPWNFARGSLDVFPPTRLNKRPGNQSTVMYGRLEVVHVEIGPRIYTLPLPVHNKFLLVSSELGIIGLILFLWFQIAVFHHIRKGINSGDPFCQWSAMGIMAAFFASLSYMNLDLFNDDKTMQILLMIPILAMIVHGLVITERRHGH